MKILLIAYIISLLLVIWNHGGYLIILFIVSQCARKPHRYDPQYLPGVTIIIPTYNEDMVIKGKLENILSQEYPRAKCQIIVVDSASTDATRQIVQSYHSHGVELVEDNERRGKGYAVKCALDHTRNEIVIVTDANAYFLPNTVRALVAHFSDPEIGGVTGRFFVVSDKKNAAAQGTGIFREFENTARYYESAIHSAISLFGEIFAIRKELFAIDEMNLTEDLDTSLYIVQKGYRLWYEPKAEAYEYAPENTKDVFIQRKRVITGTIQTLCKYRRMLWNIKYGLYGLLILPGHKLANVLSPAFMLIFLLLSIYFWKVSFCLFLLALVLAKITVRLLKTGGRVFDLIKYITLVNYACILAWKDYISGRYTVKWDKMVSTRRSLNV